MISSFLQFIIIIIIIIIGRGASDLISLFFSTAASSFPTYDFSSLFPEKIQADGCAFKVLLPYLPGFIFS